MSDLSIRIKGLTKSFKDQIVFKNVNLMFEDGKIYGIVGENGSGKTLLFKIICGFVLPTEGEIFVYNKRLDKKNPFPKDTGIVIERSGFVDNYTARKNLKYLTLLNKNVSDEIIDEALFKVCLDPKSKKKYKNFSLGMKQKLAIAQAIFENPKILILDEPLNSLDEESASKIKDILLDMKKEGKLILLASHNKFEISELCDITYKIHNYTISEINQKF